MNDNKFKNNHKQIKQRNYKKELQKLYPFMTAKLKKELANQKRGGSVSEQPRSSANAIDEAVDQVEQTTGAAVQEAGQQIKRGVSRAVTKAKKDRQQAKGQASR